MRRTDRSQPFYRSDRGRNVKMLRAILLSYSLYNYDLGYVQARPRGRASTGWCHRCVIPIEMASS